MSLIGAPHRRASNTDRIREGESHVYMRPLWQLKAVDSCEFAAAMLSGRLRDDGVEIIVVSLPVA